jgi:maltose alpha-D-glucosyltransferase/alpha-amylase
MHMTDERQTLATIDLPGDWESLFQRDGWAALEGVLPDYMRARRWFGGKARQIASARVQTAIPLRYDGATAYLTLVRVTYAEGGAETNVLPLTFANAERSAALLRDVPHAVVARVAPGAGDGGVLFDPLYDPAFCAVLLELIAAEAQIPSPDGDLIASTTQAFGRLHGPGDAPLAPTVSTAEQSNTSVIFGERLIMKLFRRLEPGLNPDLEIGRFLTERSDFAHIPLLAGAIEYRRDGVPMSLALLQGFVPNRGDAWYYSLEMIAEAFQRLLAAPGEFQEPTVPDPPLLNMLEQPLPALAHALLGEYLGSADLLGRRTAELHLALASGTDDPDFAPEPCTPEYQQSVYASMEARAQQSFLLLRQGVSGLPAALRDDARKVLGLEQSIFERLSSALAQPISALRTRIHGDYHLGQVLYTGADFFIIDFEGEPARPLSERRLKSLALQDVAGMLRSFHNATYAVLLGQAPGAAFGDEQFATLEPWARRLHRWVGAAFLRSYLATTGAAAFLPQSRAELQTLLDAYLLDKAVYELRYELNNRPTWARIPIEGILQLMQ